MRIRPGSYLKPERSRFQLRPARGCLCGRPIKYSMHLVCQDCWWKIPKALRDELWEAYKTAPGTDRHCAAIRNCYEALHAHRKQEVL